MIKVFIRKEQSYTDPIRYILTVLAQNKHFELQFTDQKEGAVLVIDDTDDQSIPINKQFYDRLLIQKQYDYSHYLKNEPSILFENGEKDYLATAFYLINSFQEYSGASTPEKLDRFGRFKYEHSLQYHFDCIQENSVQQCFNSFCEENPLLKKHASSTNRTRVFLTHDIDTIYGSFLQDGFWALKKGRLDIILKLILKEIIRKPEWKNIDQIAKIHSENDLISCFFWLATSKIAENKVKNADYNIRKESKLIKPSSFNGLHKSCFTSSLDEEIEQLPFDTSLNRYHFLKFSLPDAWKLIDNSGINLDASLGFAEHFGFRNSYGLPFSPYNIESQKAFDFLEVPLHVMDSTFQHYMKIPVNQSASSIISFLEKHKSDAIISILWHNTFFTNYKYKGYLDEYKKIIFYLVENGIQSVTPDELLNEYLYDN